MYVLKSKKVIVFIIGLLILDLGLSLYFFVYRRSSPVVTDKIISGEKKDEDFFFGYGIGGEVSKSVRFDDKMGKTEVSLTAEQKKAYEKEYPSRNFTQPIQVTGEVVKIDPDSYSIRVKTDDGEGWIKISSTWQGNVLRQEGKEGDYAEVDTIDFTKDEWGKMVNYLSVAKKIQLICDTDNCQDTIGGHIYIN